MHVSYYKNSNLIRMKSSPQTFYIFVESCHRLNGDIYYLTMDQLHSAEDLEALVLRMGFLPFFKNEIADFSIEEFTPSEYWFSDENEGPWDWKGPVARNGQCAYGKLFSGKAGFVSMKWFPELVNYRRASYQIGDNQRIAGVDSKEKLIYDTVIAHESLLSKEIKSLCGFKAQKKQPEHSSLLLNEMEASAKRKITKPKTEGYETLITRLQMKTYLVTADFEYQYDKHNQPYGWGIARYTTPELLFGEAAVLSCQHSPEESKQRMMDYLSQLLPQATEAQLLRVIG